jgi:hypothetical protein
VSSGIATSTPQTFLVASQTSFHIPTWKIPTTTVNGGKAPRPTHIARFESVSL